MGTINICGAAPGSALYNAGAQLMQQGASTPGPTGTAEVFLGSLAVNGFNGNASAVWGAIATMGAMTLDLPQALIGTVGLVVSAAMGVLDAGLDPSQGGACKQLTGGTQVTSSAQLSQLVNQTFYNLTGMSPMQWSASNGAYATGSSGTDTGGITAIVGGYASNRQQ